MSKDIFKKALGITLKFEGGYSNHPNDNGGATNFGITQRVYNEHTGSNKDVKNISMKEVEEIYYKGYWCKSYCDYMPDPVAIVTFDTAVNCGTKAAIKMLQQALNITKDGCIGKETIQALGLITEPLEVAKSIIHIRSEYYMKIVARDSTQSMFLFGWKNRLLKLSNILLQY